MTLLPWKRAHRDPSSQPQSFEDLAVPLLPALYNVARWLTRDPTEAEDLVQETILKALRGFAGFEPGSNFKAWIFRILRNGYLNSRTGLAATRTTALDQELESDRLPEATIDRSTPELNLLQLSDRNQIEQAMHSLPAPLLEVILLCDVEEMKYREIAVVLDIPIGTVMSRIARARATLRASLQPHRSPVRRVQS